MQGSTWRRWSTRTSASPCGTWAVRTRSARFGDTTSRTPKVRPGGGHFILHFRHLANVFIQCDLQPFINTLITRRRSPPRRATASLSGAVRVRCLAQEPLNAQLGGAGDHTSNLLVRSQPALPPELSVSCFPGITYCIMYFI